MEINNEETAGQMLARLGTDASAWADEFVGMFHILNHDGQELDHDEAWGLMVGWFANALEAGESAGYAKGRKWNGNQPDASWSTR